VHVHRDGEHLTFADDLGRDGSDEREVCHGYAGVHLIGLGRSKYANVAPELS
jgi:hypothetical protein